MGNHGEVSSCLGERKFDELEKFEGPAIVGACKSFLFTESSHAVEIKGHGLNNRPFAYQTFWYSSQGLNNRPFDAQSSIGPFQY